MKLLALLKILIATLILMMSNACQSTTEELWDNPVYTQFVDSACLLPEKGLLLIGDNCSYLITSNYQETIQAAKTGTLSTPEIILDADGNFQSLLVFRMPDDQQCTIPIKGQTVKVTNPQGLTRLPSSIMLRVHHTLHPIEIGGKVILTPIAITYDASKVAAVTGIVVVAAPVIIYAILNWPRW